MGNKEIINQAHEFTLVERCALAAVEGTAYAHYHSHNRRERKEWAHLLLTNIMIAQDVNVSREAIVMAIKRGRSNP